MKITSFADRIWVLINSCLSNRFIPDAIGVNCSITCRVHGTDLNLYPVTATAKGVSYPRCFVGDIG